MITTPNMGLTEWDLSSDPYDHSQLAANFGAIDIHDHSSGKGVKIGTAGIQNGAITNALLAANSVNGSNVVDGSITLTDLAPGTLTGLIPLGVTASWWRPSGTVSVPTGWVIPIGQTITSGNHGFDLGSGPGVGSITVPDLRNTFILGADTSGTGTGPSTPPAIGAAGGANTRDLRHTHNAPNHTHTVAPHAHTVNSHSHAVSNHSHGIPNDVIKWPDDVGTPVDLAVRSVFCSNGSLTVSSLPAGLEFAFIPNNIHTSGQPNEQVPTNTHNHSGNTSNSSGVTTDAQSPGTSTTGLTTDPATGVTGNPNTDFSAVDLRPKFVGLLQIMRVLY